jgi:catechol-2,3-dioxygenase
MKNQKQNTTTDYAAIFFVRNLEQQIQFYTETIGLQLQWRNISSAGLGGCKTNVLLLTTDRTTDNNKTDNNKLEITLPNRRELAKVIGRLCTIKYRNASIDFGDRHAAVLEDPEGNEITISVRTNGGPLEKPAPLDIESLFNELDPEDRLCDKMPEEARVKQPEAE